MARRPLSLILALGANGALGRGGQLPWSEPEDREHFERTTRGHVVIMGRRTWEEEGRPLPDRTNIVVSRSFVPPAGSGVLAAETLDDALALAWTVDPEPFVIGGARMFEEALPKATRIYLTEIPSAPDADVFFALDRSGFRVVEERAGARGLRFLVLEPRVVAYTSLDATRASALARVALGHVTQEYPNKLDHVLDAAADVASPRSLHPIFYGSFDWHSCVHGYWLLTHLYWRFPALSEAPRIRDVVDAHFTAENVAGELRYLARPSSRTFERPYGWAWLLALAAELARHGTPEGARWRASLAPLASAFAERFLEWLPRATHPVRSGTHHSTAFALSLALEYAEATNDERLAGALRAKARAWYEHDRDAQVWEPSGEDFLSPALIEAECMRRALDRDDYERWLAAFLPRLAQGEPKALFSPVQPSDRTDGRIAHLDGLNLSRAWCLRGIARALGGADRLLAAAEAHLEASLPHVTGHYMGEHWLATYAALALEA